VRHILLVLVLAAGSGLPIGLVGCVGEAPAGPAIEVVDARARPAARPAAGPGPAATAVYLRIRNRGRRPDTLKGATTEVAARVELHETVVGADGVARMRPAPSVTVPARGEVSLRPGGLHLMLMGLTRELRPGDRFDLFLEFDDGDRHPVTVEVVDR